MTPAFIVGADRSGTTLLRLIVNEHPLVAVPAETWFLIDLMDEFGVTGKLDGPQLTRAIEIVGKKRRWRNFHVSCDELRSRLEERPQISLEEFFDTLMSLEIAPTGKPRWVDKTPEYVLHIGRLVTVFPTAKFVHITRDGRDVFRSLRKQRWRGRTPLRIASYWAACIDAGLAAGHTLGPGQMLSIRYEDLVLDMEATTRRVCRFLDLSYDPGMLSFHIAAAAHVPRQSIDRGFHTKLLRPPTDTDAFRWKQERFEWRGWLFESMVLDQLWAAGYEARLSHSLARLIRPIAFGHHLVASAAAKLMKRRPLRESRSPGTS